jgi:hypothetical protein
MICPASTGLIVHNDLDLVIGWIDYVVAQLSHRSLSHWSLMEGQPIRKTVTVDNILAIFVLGSGGGRGNRKTPSSSA